MLMQWKKLLSARRLGSADNSAVQPGRSPFQQDFDRIVFSSSFRKLHDKAQVFPLSDEDNVRTRLTHSMETASIGRSLGAIAGVGICEKLGESHIRPNHIGEIVAAASLAHDIGNPPFGHSGEESIRYWFTHSQIAAELRKRMTADEIVRGVEKLQPIPHRLQLIQSGGVYILDDGYNCNPKGAEEALAALKRFSGRKCLVTPGIVECGVLEESINQALGEKIAKANFDKVILVGETLVGAVKKGYQDANGNRDVLVSVPTLDKAQTILKTYLQEGDAVLFMNDLPDVY